MPRSAYQAKAQESDNDNRSRIKYSGAQSFRGLVMNYCKHQPRSTLTRWFLERTMGQGGCVKRIMIVAVNRKLAIALWSLSRA